MAAAVAELKGAGGSPKETIAQHFEKFIAAREALGWRTSSWIARARDVLDHAAPGVFSEVDRGAISVYITALTERLDLLDTAMTEMTTNPFHTVGHTVIAIDETSQEPPEWLEHIERLAGIAVAVPPQ